MITKMKHKQPMDSVNLAGFKSLCASFGSLVVYPAMGIMERVLGESLKAPDDGIDVDMFKHF